MRKYIVGILIGFVLSFAAGAHAEVITMINKVVEGTFPVTVEGKKLEADAVVIEGNTYLPVRAFGEAIGYDVSFNPEMGVSMGKITTLPAPIVETPTTEITTEKELNKIENRIEILNTDIWGVKASLSTKEKSDPDYQDYQDRLAKYEEELSNLEKRKTELQQ